MASHNNCLSKHLTTFFVLLLIVGIPSAFADVKQIKIYKEAYPDSKPKCAHCHVDTTPKKEDGKHDLNDYGKKVKAIAETITADNYKQAGPYQE